MAFNYLTDLKCVQTFTPQSGQGTPGGNVVVSFAPILPVPGLFLHQTNDAKATVQGAGYFNQCATGSPYPYLAVGSIILSVSNQNTTPVFNAYIVTAVTSTVVTVALFSVT